MKIFKKIGLLILIYGIFFIVSYGLFLLLLKIIFNQTHESFSSGFVAIYILIFVPILSFLIIPKYLIKKHNFNKYFVWIFDVIVVYLAALFFIIKALSTFTWGGF